MTDSKDHGACPITPPDLLQDPTPKELVEDVATSLEKEAAKLHELGLEVDPLIDLVNRLNRISQDRL